jgi:hypothetical protein
MNSPLLCDFLETLVEELAAPEGAVNTACRATFQCSPLIVRGSWFGDDRLLSERHAPFIAIFPADTPAEVEVHRTLGVGAAPRTFGITIAIGSAVTEPVEPPPEIDAQNAAPLVYSAGGESDAERFAYAVLNAATARFNQFGFFPTDITLDYSGALAWPLIVYEFTLNFAANRVLRSGIC